MNRLISHIEFLLHDHNCVIIPDFGGFVVNSVSSGRSGISTFNAPACELVFNRELIHNDGLLAQSYMRNSGMSFELSMQKITQDANELKRQLHEQRSVDMGKLGVFTMHDDKRFVYTPGSFVRPGFFGLTQAVLKPLIQMVPAIPDRKSGNRQKLARSVGLSAAAVAVIALLMFIFPVSDTAIGRQSARIISETDWLRSGMSQPANSTIITDALPDKTERAEELPTAANGVIAPEADLPALNITADMPKYYIVMGVYSFAESAQIAKQMLIDEGFHQTEWLERTGRFDVYAASFTEKDAADVYLKEVFKKFPTHTDAWILKR